MNKETCNLKIRITGLPDELDTAIEELRRSFTIRNISRPYKNRNSDYHRVYLDVEIRKE